MSATAREFGRKYALVRFVMQVVTSHSVACLCAELYKPELAPSIDKLAAGIVALGVAAIALFSSTNAFIQGKALDNGATAKDPS